MRYFKTYRTNIVESRWYRKLHEPGYDDRPIFRELSQYNVTGGIQTASWSLDHKQPHGSVREQYYFLHYLLVKAFINLFSVKSWIDLGCGVGSISLQAARLGIDDVIAIEGSDVPIKSGLVRFAHSNYIVADVTLPLEIRKVGGEQATFDVVSAMEFVEHIPDDRLKTVFDNILKLKPKWIVLSIGLLEEPYHINLKTMQAWIDILSQSFTSYCYNDKISEQIFLKCKKHVHLVDVCEANHLPDGRKLIVFEKTNEFEN